MLFDKNNTFSLRQDLAKVQGTYLSDKSIDTGPVGTIPAMFKAVVSTGLRDVGKGEPVEVLTQVVEDFTGTTGTLQADLVMADNEALSSNLTVLDSSPVIALAALKAGYKFTMGAVIPPIAGTVSGATPAKRWLGIRYVIATATMTAGKVTSGIVVDKQTAGT